MIPRQDVPEIADLYVTGTLSFNLSDRTDEFDVELRGTKVRSLFFLKQVSGGATPQIVEIEGTWLGETNYVACEGRIAIPAPNHVAKPYFFVVRTADVEVPSVAGGNWVQNIDFVVQKSTLALDTMADKLSVGGSLIKESLGTLLTQVAVIARELRGMGTPYLT